ncbi:MAG: relaxase/mobilization nuclease domain-containing protein [Candidatus Pseudobacter hemicellulosilyticus]|uniref:Relaxase/mobilization nuclease domain-containing protein n=1 Tax=Candidatus Pseudobacter hemicellulosilyticus TaxID=3121375 RepID=A0AAJ6BIC9_9BACT|nr:MAG: relaxase/mobilization nuclease domain-containing protein [Pseudobacter sp.]
MVAIVSPSEYLSDTFHYNENKVDAGVAECLLAENYPLDAGEMTKGQRFIRLKKRTELNPQTKLNTLHISLNFPVQEAGMFSDKDKLRTIARDYMQRLGYADQPYLLYEHRDAGHPHLHIVTTCIDENGENKGLHNIHLTSNVARKAIEEHYGLIKAEGQQPQEYSLKPVNASVVQYGQKATKSEIANVLVNVLKSYHYTTLGELNALLQLYNVTASQGLPGSRIHQHGGLQYQALSPDGERLGKPVKASLFPYKPTLKFLKRRYAANIKSRMGSETALRKDIDLMLFAVPPPTFPDFLAALRAKGIDTCILRNEQGRTYGISYIDHRSKAVFKGSTLGDEYGINSILRRCAAPHKPELPTPTIAGIQEKQTAHTPETASTTPDRTWGDPAGQDPADNTDSIPRERLLELLLQYESVYEYVAFGFRKKKKKKKTSRGRN